MKLKFIWTLAIMISVSIAEAQIRVKQFKRDEKIIADYRSHRNVLEDCLNGETAESSASTCVQSYNEVKRICHLVSDGVGLSEKRGIPARYADEACSLTYRAENKLGDFYEIDAQNCAKGNENLRERLVSLNQNRTRVGDQFFLEYEQALCAQFKSYVNLCEYVDGHLKETIPKDVSRLPRINLSRKLASACAPKAANSEDGISTMEYDFANLSKNLNENVSIQMIQGYRSRMMASKSKTFVLCHQVRNSFANLGCARYESIQSGLATFAEDPKKNFKPADHQEQELQGSK